MSYNKQLLDAWNQFSDTIAKVLHLEQVCNFIEALPEPTAPVRCTECKFRHYTKGGYDHDIKKENVNAYVCKNKKNMERPPSYYANGTDNWLFFRCEVLNPDGRCGDYEPKEKA